MSRADAIRRNLEGEMQLILRPLRDPRKPMTMTLTREHAMSAPEVNTPLTWHCVMCGLDTHPGAKERIALREELRTKGKSRVRFDHRTEAYYVLDSVWKRVRMEQHDGCLCVGCLEKTLEAQAEA
jgi:hypothetical protein